jgi:hypothetical protein
LIGVAVFGLLGIRFLIASLGSLALLKTISKTSPDIDVLLATISPPLFVIAAAVCIGLARLLLQLGAGL